MRAKAAFVSSTDEILRSRTARAAAEAEVNTSPAAGAGF
jgi:hypothetical protein